MLVNDNNSQNQNKPEKLHWTIQFFVFCSIVALASSLKNGIPNNAKRIHAKCLVYKNEKYCVEISQKN
jgi:hypothetical protein